MPSRVIRASINRSASLAQVSLEADLTFRALLLACDDYGRLDARPEVLKAELFPMRDRVTPAKVRRWVEELAALADPPVQFYQVDGREYLYLPKWDIHRSNSHRAAVSKYPQPNAVDAPGVVPEIRDSPGDPPVLRVSGDECRVTSTQIVAPASPALVSSPQAARNGHSNGAPKPRLTLMPDALEDAEWDRLVRLTTRHKLSEAELMHASHAVYAWSHGGAKRRSDWVLVILNAIRAGWALKGF